MRRREAVPSRGRPRRLSGAVSIKNNTANDEGGSVCLSTANPNLPVLKPTKIASITGNTATAGVSGRGRGGTIDLLLIA
ncbi:MAG: hypothetical protein ACR2J8_12930 [Thermomicrobiales bacterium]